MEEVAWLKTMDGITLLSVNIIGIMEHYMTARHLDQDGVDN